MQRRGQRYGRVLSRYKECDWFLLDGGKNVRLVFDGVMFSGLGSMTLSPRLSEYDGWNVIAEGVRRRSVVE